MKEVTGYLYSGKTSERKEVRIHFYPPDQVLIIGSENTLTYRLSEVRITSRVGNTPRFIYLPDGAKCETMDNEAIDAILSHHGRDRWQAFLHRLESKLGYVFLTFVFTVGSVWGLIEYGIPGLAKRLAHAMPASVNASFGKEGLKVLDKVLFSPSELDEKGKNHLLSVFIDMTKGIEDTYHFRLEFRKSDRIGPNAFALPSGIIVVTDELVLLAKHENELIAIIAHEIGHVMHRHALRNLLQDSAVVLLVASISGDVTSVTSLSAALPTMLMEAKYPRAFEMEADRFALQYLQKHSIPSKHFADILIRLGKETGHESETRDYLASHPSTSERIRMFQGEEQR